MRVDRVARALNAVSLGEEVATTLGVDGDRFRRIGFLVASLSTGVLVAVTGGIGFVGLMVPHFVRLVIGADHRRLLPASALAGAIFLIWADVLARTIVAPEELPIGIVTAFAGAPFFLWLMRSRGRSGVGVVRLDVRDVSWSVESARVLVDAHSRRVQMARSSASWARTAAANRACCDASIA